MEKADTRWHATDSAATYYRTKPRAVTALVTEKEPLQQQYGAYSAKPKLEKQKTRAKARALLDYAVY